MSSERDPLLTTPSQHHADVQGQEVVSEEKKLGPLEISRSNRWAILGGVWIANFLGVRHTIPCLDHFSNRPVASGSELCVYKLSLLALLNHLVTFSYHGGNSYVVRDLFARPR